MVGGGVEKAGSLFSGPAFGVLSGILFNYYRGILFDYYLQSPVGKYAYIAEIYVAIAVLYLFLVCYGGEKVEDDNKGTEENKVMPQFHECCTFQIY